MIMMMLVILIIQNRMAESVREVTQHEELFIEEGNVQLAFDKGC